ncbi:hypothetical protein K461DRAFT_279805 [Myriangium duriaei CBS 260.36]|uniref:Helicase ATP-binding domain-containing protein n=1 Tax=Myriangium duriaei CBS 260.36 TaxID=1168546 RepID=A0A9P4MKR0_9PEZI|nr:hypothetical protein K461DRAFT_279805 [Myriangium duriaei CBS 260.36]
MEVDPVNEEPTDADYETNDSLHGAEIPTSEAYVQVGNSVFGIEEYLGDEWSQQILKVHDPEQPLEPPSGMATELWEWQKSLLPKMQVMGDSHRRGGIIGDEKGMGKTLAAIAYCQARHRGNARRLSTLVITTNTGVADWVNQLVTHFTPDARPHHLVLNDPSLRPQSLLEGRYDFVLCSFDFLELQFVQLLEHLHRDHSEKELDMGTVKQYLESNAKLGLTIEVLNCLYTKFWRVMDRPFDEVIVDEAHCVGQQHTLRHMAIDALHRDQTFLLMDGFPPDDWTFLCGHVNLLQDHVFNTYFKFMKHFASQKEDGTFADYPSETKFNRLVKFLQAMVVARPRALPPSGSEEVPDGGKKRFMQSKADTKVRLSAFLPCYDDVQPIIPFQYPGGAGEHHKPTPAMKAYYKRK